MSLFIYYYRINFGYELDYLSSQKQYYPQMTQLKNCLIIYLIESLLFDSLNDKVMVIHHLESISGLIFGQLGNFVGATNNTVLNEISSIWLCLFTILKDSPNRILKESSMSFFFIFVYSFINNRIIPLTKMSYIFFGNISYLSTVKLFHVINFFLLFHTIIQYYWLFLMGRKIIRKIYK